MNASSLTERVTATPWWLVLLEGIALFLAGILLLTAPLTTIVFLVQILGLYWLVTGILSLVSIFGDSSSWGWKLFVGILGIIAGLAVLRHPLWSSLLIPATLVTFLGIIAIVMGAINLFQAFSGGGWGTALLGVINIILGIILLSSPMMAVAALPLVLGIFAIVGGIATIALAFRVRSVPTEPAGL